MLAHPVEMLLSLADVARLAHVQRPVVSMWRRRAALSNDPFPLPVRHHGEQEFFDAFEVGQWLNRTGRGNNPSAEQDAPAYARLSSATLNDLSAVLTLRALATEPISGWSVDDLLDFADEHDSDDTFFYTELQTNTESLTKLAQVADQMTDAAYTPEAAHEQILAARKRSELPHHQYTAISDDLAELCADVARSLADTTNISTFGEATPGGAELLVALIHLLDQSHCSSVNLIHEDSGSFTTQNTALRLAQRRIRVLAASRDWISSSQHSIPHSPRVVMAQFPGPADPYSSDTDTFQRIDELILSLGEYDSALIVASASILIDDLDRDFASYRSQMLRSGRVRAAVRLPQGLTPAKVRLPMALWILGPEQRNLPISDRRTMVADLTDIPLTFHNRQELVSDITSTLGTNQETHARSFRFGRLFPTRSLIAGAGALTSPLRVSPRAQIQDTRVGSETLISLERTLALWDRQRETLPALPLIVDAGLQQPASWTTLEALLREGALEYLPGTRVQDYELKSPHLDGLPVWDAQIFSANGNTRDVYRMQLTDFSINHPSAQLTEPGDVVFQTGKRHGARVDQQGASIIRYPLRSLRPKPGYGIVSQVLAEDMSLASGGPWHQWQVRRFSPEVATELTGALEQLNKIRNILTNRIEHLAEIASLLTTGVATGAVRSTLSRKESSSVNSTEYDS